MDYNFKITISKIHQNLNVDLPKESFNRIYTVFMSQAR